MCRIPLGHLRGPQLDCTSFKVGSVIVHVSRPMEEKQFADNLNMRYDILNFKNSTEKRFRAIIRLEQLSLWCLANWFASMFSSRPCPLGTVATEYCREFEFRTIARFYASAQCIFSKDRSWWSRKIISAGNAKCNLAVLILTCRSHAWLQSFLP